MRKNKTIYMDHHATTPVDPAVLRAMLPYFSERFGNAASSGHSFGILSARAVDEARGKIASLIGAQKREIIFTSGATEANNLAIKGIAEACRSKKKHFVTTVIEHKSVLDSFKRLETRGFRVIYLPVDSEGLVDLAELKKAVRNAALVSIGFANNEIGVIQPVSAIGKICHQAKVLFHTDATQAVGRVPVNVRGMNIDLLSFSAHKIYGPKGVGALFVRKKAPWIHLIPQMDGGGHEGGLRSGTLNVPSVVGFGKACEIGQKQLKSEPKRQALLRNRLERGLLREIPGTRINGSRKKRLPNNLNLSLPGIISGDVLKALKKIAISSGSACLSTSQEPSYILKSIGLTEEERMGSLRFGLGRFNRTPDVDAAVQEVAQVVKRLKRRQH